ncbi:hypothetical protein TrLO_g309 [Triparma laevis f. longispina]|uniref:Uncharacterized protein n=1 Tax=Triparma laevis f. longispina TaxID=1714387 RepID=A0A9W7FNW8_9STRA|nr:hypothetical protein TrLO_g309 [Triparma laevis f. longispina]
MRLSALIAILLPAGSWAGSLVDSYPDTDLLGGDKYCYSGRAESQFRCPSDDELNPSSSTHYPTTTLLSGEYVTVKINNLRMTGEGRKRNGGDEVEGGGEGGGGGGRRLVEPVEMTYQIQISLMQLLEDYEASNLNCCWEEANSACDWERQEGEAPTVELPPECKMTPGQGMALDASVCSVRQGLDFSDAVAMTGRPGVYKSGPSTTVVTSITVDLKLDGDAADDLEVILKPPKPNVEYLVMVSNCALIHSETKGSDVARTEMNHFMFDITFNWNFSHGSLPHHLLGLIPFYAVAFVCYVVMTILWVKRSIQFQGQLLGLQKAVSLLVYLECGFTFIAMLYYVHVNASKSIDMNVLYSGTFAALVSWDFWTILVTVAHFSTIFACQVVVTLTADGKWLIQHSMRRSTRVFLVFLGSTWAIFIMFYGVMDAESRNGWAVFSASVWIAWLLISVRNSLRHIKSLTVGNSDDNIMVAHPGSAGGDMLTAKRGLFRKLCCLIATFPAVFMLTLILDSQADKTSWGIPWIGYVLTDIYILGILSHVTYLWLPSPALDPNKYAPVNANDMSFDGDFEMGGVMTDERDDNLVE